MADQCLWRSLDHRVPRDEFVHPAGDEPMLCASFSKIWPVGYLHDRMLGPRIDDVPQTQRKIVEKKRRARSAKVIADNQLIPRVRPSP